MRPLAAETEFQNRNHAKNRQCDDITLNKIKSYVGFTDGVAVWVLFVRLLACLLFYLFSREVLLMCLCY